MNLASIILVGLLLWLVFGAVVATLSGAMLKERTPPIAVRRQPAKIPAKPVLTFPSPDSSQSYLN
jgi:hypothetical protein